MDGDSFGRLTYLALLGAVIAGYLILENRQRLARIAQQAVIWGLIFIGIIAVFGLWSDIRTTVFPQQAVFTDGAQSGAGRIEVPRSPDGHYYLTLKIDGTAVNFIVDTGATDVVLSREDALRLGIDLNELNFLGRAGTANGMVRTARVTLRDVRLGPVNDARLTAWVSDGEMPGSLLGMAYLERFDRIEIARNRLILSR